MKCDSPFWTNNVRGERVPVPCGRCPPCKLRRVNGWVFRMLEELKVSSSSAFVTLTYDTRTVPISDNGFMTLRKRDLQLYFKRLRKLCPDVRLRYYAVGEYGTKNNRPHYHLICFNCPDQAYFFDAWSLFGTDFGAVHVGKVTSDSIAYCMKYIDKPHFEKRHARDDREKEFPLMSKGLGASYLSPDVVNYHKADISRLYATKEGGHRIALPRYYRDKIYSASEREAQKNLIQVEVEKDEIRQRLHFRSIYGEKPPISYEQWLENKRLGRYHSFYRNQKNRDL